MKRRRRHPLYPEPGAWVLDQSQGLPSIERPEPLPRDRLLSAGTIRDDYVAYEGLGYCIYDYIPPEKIADPKLRQLWKGARRAMQDVVECLSAAGPAEGVRREFNRSRKKRAKAKAPKLRTAIPEEDSGPIGEVIS